MIRNIAAGFYARQIFEVGLPLEVLGQSGALKAITATHIIIESPGREVSVSNSAVLRATAKQ